MRGIGALEFLLCTLYSVYVRSQSSTYNYSVGSGSTKERLPGGEDKLRRKETPDNNKTTHVIVVFMAAWRAKLQEISLHTGGYN